MNRITKEMVAGAVEHNKGVRLTTGKFVGYGYDNKINCACALSQVYAHKINYDLSTDPYPATLRDESGEFSIGGLLASQGLSVIAVGLDLDIGYVRGFVMGFDHAAEDYVALQLPTPEFIAGVKDGAAARGLLK
jgi:hypothetical protein